MNALTNLICGAAAGSLLAFGAAAAAPKADAKAGVKPGKAVKQRSPRNACRLTCRNARKACVRSGKSGAVCWRERSSCYRACRKSLPPTPKTAGGAR